MPAKDTAVVCRECGTEHSDSFMRCPNCDCWDKDIHIHECGYCGNEFPQIWDKVNEQEPCRRCRSRKKSCDCEPELVLQ